MNLTNFLKQTDAVTAQYSAPALCAFIHDIARILPEHNRDDFLKRLKAVGGEAKKPRDKEKESILAFDEKYRIIQNNLKLIDSQEVMITGIRNYEYDEWYSSEDEEFYYEDHSGISPMLAEACDFVHTCMDMERYREGYEIGNQMFLMGILCEDEDGGEEISLGDMVYHELLDYDLKQVILDTACCAYYAEPLKERAQALYEIIENAGDKEITLEAIMQYGEEELPDFQNFLPLWIHYLGSWTGYDADRLISEAVGLLNDISMAVTYAEQYVSIHPGLYLDILEHEKSADVNELISIGMKAMEIMPGKYTMRSKVALKAAEYIIKANGNRSLLERCYFAAYESDTSIVNYLRVLLSGSGEENKKDELQKVFMGLPVCKSHKFYGMSDRDYSGSERQENKPDSNMILLLRFFDGQFEDVLAQGLDKSEALGWSGTFMKQGIALYLLYLHEGPWNGKGMAAMAAIVKRAMHFSADEYRKGTKGLDGLNEDDLFYQLFLKWKSTMHMEQDVKTSAIKKITGLLEKRTEGIMNANHRNYYGECAAYIAALGEVEETLGNKGAKQRLMTSYKEKYPRRSAFRADMQSYGWIDVKKKK